MDLKEKDEDVKRLEKKLADMVLTVQEVNHSKQLEVASLQGKLEKVRSCSEFVRSLFLIVKTS